MTSRYAAFISYSQKDKVWAKRLHRALESYRLPKGVVAESQNGNRIGRIFRDDDELGSAPSLGAALEGAIDDSAVLIVICSPNSARSKWVDLEIRQFKKRGKDAKVLAIVVGGQPFAADPEQECFPAALTRHVSADAELGADGDEPLAADATKDTFPRVLTRVVAGLVGTDFDSLWQREKRRIARRRMFAAAASVVLMAAGAAAYFQLNQAQQNELRAQSLKLASDAQSAMDDGRLEEARRTILTALPADLANTSSWTDRPVVPEAVVALRRAMGESRAVRTLARFDQPIDDLGHTRKKQVAVYLDDGAVALVNASTGAVLRKYSSSRRLRPLAMTGLAYTLDNTDRKLSDGTWTLDKSLRVVDLDTGDALYNLSRSGHNWRLKHVLAPDGTRVLAQGLGGSTAARSRLTVFKLSAAVDGNNKSGSLLAETDAPFIDTNFHLSAGFGGQETVFLSWGQARKTLAVWNVGNGPAKLLVAADDVLGCDGTRSPKDKRHDSVSLSPDRSVITHARPLGENDWCVQLWDGQSGKPLKTLIMKDTKAGGIVPLSKDLFFLAASTRSWDPTAELRSSDGARTILEGCGAGPAAPLSLEASSSRWHADIANHLVACVSSSTIAVSAGTAMQSVGDYRGHQGKLNSILWDAKQRALWSGGDDGTLRLWSVPSPALDLQSSDIVRSLAAGGSTMSALFRDQDGKWNVQAFEGSGKSASPKIPVPLTSAPPRKGVYRRMKVFLYADSETLGLADGFDCGLFAACPAPYQNRLLLWRREDGSKLAEFTDLSAASSLGILPASFYTTDSAAVLLFKDGSARLIDLASGAVKRHIVPDNGQVVIHAAFAFDRWWFIQSEASKAPEKREVTLLSLTGDGKLQKVDKRQAQYARLFASPEEDALVIAYSLTHTPRLQVAMAFVDADGSLREIKGLPSRATGYERIDFPAALSPTQRDIAVYFGNLVAPVLVRIADGSIRPLATKQPSSTSDLWRVPDPLSRAFVIVDNHQLNILSYGPAVEGLAPLCPALNGISASSAAFSADGRRLAVAEGSKVRVFDLATCTPQRSFDPGRLNSRRSLIYANDGTLWVKRRRAPPHLALPLRSDTELLQAALNVLQSLPPSR